MEMVLSGSHHQSQVVDFWTIWAEVIIGVK